MKKYFFLILVNLIPITKLFSLKRFLLRKAGVVVGENSKIAGKINISNPYNLTIGKNVWIGDNFKVYNSGKGRVEVGDNVDIAPNCSVVTGSHKIGGQGRRAGDGYNTPVKIGNGVWIGTDTTILGGSKISEGCIIAACSLVKESTENNAIYGGVPAKLIRKLTDNEEL